MKLKPRKYLSVVGRTKKWIHEIKSFKHIGKMGRGGGEMVSMLAF